MAKAPNFACNSCGETQQRWSGRCPACGTMNSIVELRGRERELFTRSGASATASKSAQALDVAPLTEITAQHYDRLRCGIGEWDRVLGGGIPRGAVALLGGEPGIGKSTLLAQCCIALARDARLCYVTAEESRHQVRERFERLGAACDGELGSAIDLASSTDTEAIIGLIAKAHASGAGYALCVIDSIQMMHSQTAESLAGTVSQIRACTGLLVEAAKHYGVAVVLVGHVTKDGNLAGPRLLEHLVDTVLTFEGDRYQDLRTLRAVKNRYGSTNEIGIFAMTGSGLQEVQDPSGLFIRDRDAQLSGSVVVPILEGNRALLVEIQALVNPTEHAQPARRVSGADANRAAMIIAVLSRRLRYPLGSADIYINVTGGARANEPAADCGIALAIASSWLDRPVPSDLVAIGEVGLGGELRPATRYDVRASEARRLGFKRLLGPGSGKGKGRIKAGSVAEAIDAVFD